MGLSDVPFGERPCVMNSHIWENQFSATRLGELPLSLLQPW